MDLKSRNPQMAVAVAKPSVPVEAPSSGAALSASFIKGLQGDRQIGGKERFRLHGEAIERASQPGIVGARAVLETLRAGGNTGPEVKALERALKPHADGSPNVGLGEAERMRQRVVNALRVAAVDDAFHTAFGKGARDFSPSDLKDATSVSGPRANAFRLGAVLSAMPANVRQDFGRIVGQALARSDGNVDAALQQAKARPTAVNVGLLHTALASRFTALINKGLVREQDVVSMRLGDAARRMAGVPEALASFDRASIVKAAAGPQIPPATDLSERTALTLAGPMRNALATANRFPGGLGSMLKAAATLDTAVDRHRGNLTPSGMRSALGVTQQKATDIANACDRALKDAVRHALGPKATTEAVASAYTTLHDAARRAFVTGGRVALPPTLATAVPREHAAAMANLAAASDAFRMLSRAQDPKPDLRDRLARLFGRRRG